MKKWTKNKYIFQLIFIIIISISFFRPLSLVYEKRSDFFSKGYTQQYETLRKAYYSSQYVNKNHPNIMPDDSFESFVGGAFIRGENPIRIVHEHPPLGRYIIGLSIILFDNPTTLILPLMLITIIGIYFISRLVLHNKLLSLIPVVIFSNEPLFMSKFIYIPLLEPIQMTFIVLSILFFILGITKEKYGRYFVLCALSLGFVISIRFFILGAVLCFSMILFFILKRKLDRKFLIFLLSLPLSLVILIASYTKTIQEGYSVLQVFSIQKYIFYYHKSKLMIYFSFWDLIMFNKWHTWWGDKRVITDSEWFILWPLSVLLSGLHMISALIKKINLSDCEKVIILWIICYYALLSIGFSTTRYFLALTPFLYIIAISFAVKLFKMFYKQN